MSRRKKQPAPIAESCVDRDYALHFGRWQDTIAMVDVDATINDAPYGSRVHASEPTRNDGVDAAGLAPKYKPWTGDDVVEWVKAISPRCGGWMLNMTSDDLITPHRDAFEDADRVHFVMPLIIKGMTCRMQGDGPSTESLYLVLARPRCKPYSSWGTMRGFYEGNRDADSSGGRGKPEWLLRALVRDYTRKGDLVADYFAGWSTTLLAALGNGRRAIGAEMDRAAYDESCRRLRGGVQLDMLAGVA